MLVNVKTEKRQQTLECHPRSSLFAVQLNKVQRLSVAHEKKPVLTSRREDLILIGIFCHLKSSTTGQFVPGGLYVGFHFKQTWESAHALQASKSEKTSQKQESESRKKSSAYN